MFKIDICALDKKCVQKFQHALSIGTSHPIKNKGTSLTLKA
jgi:hypothetical protein